MRQSRLITRKRSETKRDPLPVPLNTRSIRRERHFTRLFFLLFFDQNYARFPQVMGRTRDPFVRYEARLPHNARTVR